MHKIIINDGKRKKYSAFTSEFRKEQNAGGHVMHFYTFLITFLRLSLKFNINSDFSFPISQIFVNLHKHYKLTAS